MREGMGREQKGRGGKRRGREWKGGEETPRPEARAGAETYRENKVQRCGRKRQPGKQGNRQRPIQSCFLLSPDGPASLANARRYLNECAETISQ